MRDHSCAISSSCTDRIAVILLVQLQIDPAQVLACERLAVFRLRMGDRLKFGKHRLAVQGRAHHVEEIIEQILLHGGILRLCKQAAQQQDFVDRTCHFRHKNTVIRLGIGLIRIGIIGVQRMPHLVRNGKNIVGGLLII